MSRLPSRIAWADGNDRIYVIRRGKTTNAKIAKPTDQVVQTYTFSGDQYRYVYDQVACGQKVDRKRFFQLDKANCLDCPLSGNSGSGKCYTHKYMQFSGFVSMLKSIIKSGGVYVGLCGEDRTNILEMCAASDYLRFGTYGEPSLLPIDLVRDMVEVCPGNWTGYTHQARKEFAQPFKDYFMASAHSDKDAASITGWLSFVCVEPNDTSTAVQCPASKELSLTTCSACGLCSGVTGKGRKNIKINLH